uniref:Uncharacterized protein n=1 Tax=Myotis myotis TaxID=51298 RepID=A0A7J7V3T5_MYOMY|nr:hypothetical protein mMyoMyo1_008440 [Myotis myotis]
MSWSPESQHSKKTQALSLGQHSVGKTAQKPGISASSPRQGASEPHLCFGSLAVRIQASECWNRPECSATYQFMVTHIMSPGARSAPVLVLGTPPHTPPHTPHTHHCPLTIEEQSSEQWVYFPSASFKP